MNRARRFSLGKQLVRIGLQYFNVCAVWKTSHIEVFSRKFQIISEPETGAQNDFSTIVEELKKYLIQNIKKLQQLSEEELLKQRYEKFMSY